MHRSHRHLRRTLALGLALGDDRVGGDNHRHRRAAGRRRATEPDLGPNVIVFDPSMPVGEIQATVDEINAAADRQRDGHEPLRAAVRARRLRHGHRAAADEGRLLHGGRRPRRLAHRRRHQRQDRGLQPVPGERRHEQLPRAGELLAHALQPHAEHQRRRPGRLPRLRQLLGRLAGRVDAPCQRQRREPVADGLLHRRSAVRQWGLHRRHQDRVRHQRLAAAVADPQQRDRRLVQRRLERGVRRRRGCPDRRVVPGPAVHDARHEPAEP